MHECLKNRLKIHAVVSRQLFCQRQCIKNNSSGPMSSRYILHTDSTFFSSHRPRKTKHIQKPFTADSSVQPFIFPCFSPSSVVTVGLLTVGFASWPVPRKSYVEFPGESAAPSCANFSIFRYACACAMPINEGKVWKKYHM